MAVFFPELLIIRACLLKKLTYFPMFDESFKAPFLFLYLTPRPVLSAGTNVSAGKRTASYLWCRGEIYVYFEA